MKYGIDRERAINREIAGAARWQAERGLDGSIGTPLPPFMSVRAVNRIAAMPQTFRRLVADIIPMPEIGEHRADPDGIPSLFRVCGKPTRQWPDGRFPIHASV